MRGGETEEGIFWGGTQKRMDTEEDPAEKRRGLRKQEFTFGW